jgi:hypothetical protein
MLGSSHTIFSDNLSFFVSDTLRWNKLVVCILFWDLAQIVSGNNDSVSKTFHHLALSSPGIFKSRT